MAKIQVHSEKIIFDKVLQLKEAQLTYVDKQNAVNFSRIKINRQDAAAVLVFDVVHEEFILTRQFRYAVYGRVEGELLEIVAGKVDPDEDHRKTAIRETREEIGFEIREENLMYIHSFFASPGYTSEKYHLYYAEVNSSDQISKGGGLESENEFIEIVRVPRIEFLQLLKDGKIEDAKTYVSGLWFSLNR